MVENSLKIFVHFSMKQGPKVLQATAKMNLSIEMTEKILPN